MSLRPTVDCGHFGFQRGVVLPSSSTKRMREEGSFCPLQPRKLGRSPPSKEPREEPEGALNSLPAFAGEMSRNETEGEAKSLDSPRTRCFKRTTRVDPRGFPLRPRKLGHLPRPKSRGRNQNRGDGAREGGEDTDQQTSIHRPRSLCRRSRYRTNRTCDTRACDPDSH
jgi:hypothetical protein